MKERFLRFEIVIARVTCSSLHAQCERSLLLLLFDLLVEIVDVAVRSRTSRRCRWFDKRFTIGDAIVDLMHDDRRGGRRRRMRPLMAMTTG